MLKTVFFLSFFSFFLFSCGKDEVILEEQVIVVNKLQSTENLDILLGSLTTLEVNVFFEGGADPYVGKTPGGKYFWDLLEGNLTGIFQRKSLTVAINVPKTLDQMTAINPSGKESWTNQEIKDLAESVGEPNSTATIGRITLLFLNGRFKNNDGLVLPGVIGVSITGTTIVAVFKDVVRHMGQDQDDAVAKFAEQSTIIHEIGHAFGLVNSGLPLTSEHQDTQHGAHCNNPRCVMFWQNEGASDMIEFARQFMLSGSNVMYDEACLNDIQGYSPTAKVEPTPTPTATPTATP